MFSLIFILPSSLLFTLRSSLLFTPLSSFFFFSFFLLSIWFSLLRICFCLLFNISIVSFSASFSFLTPGVLLFSSFLCICFFYWIFFFFPI